MDLTSYRENPETLTVNYSCFFEKLLGITYRIKHDLPIKCQAIHLGASDNAIWMAISLDYSPGVQYSLLKESKRQGIKKKEERMNMDDRIGRRRYYILHLKIQFASMVLN